MNNIFDKNEEIKNNLEQKGRRKKKEKTISKKEKETKNIENLEKDLNDIKLQSIQGFIIIDFPNNLNQWKKLKGQNR